MIRSSLRRLKQWAFPVPPLQYVSGWTLVPEGDITTLLPAQRVPTPEAAEMDFIPFSAYLKSPTYTAPTVRSAVLRGTRYCPTNHCVVAENGDIILESTGPGARPVELQRRALQRPTKRIPGLAVPFRCFFNNYYHTLVDNLSRFDLLNFDHFRKYPSISLLCPGGLTPLEAFFVRSLLPENVTICPIEPGVMYAPDGLLLNSFITARSSAYLRGPYVERLRSGVRQPSVAPRRLLLSRRDANTRRVRNEPALLDRLRPFGFERCIPGTLSPTEQIALFQTADLVVAPHGAGLTNLLFSPHTSVLELFGSPYVLPHYYLLSKALGHRYAYMLGPEADPEADFDADIEGVVTQVAALVNAAPVDRRSPTSS